MSIYTVNKIPVDSRQYLHCFAPLIQLVSLAHVISTIKTQLKCTSALRLLGRFTTCLAQTTRHFVPRECEFFWKFSILNFFKFGNIMMT